VATGGFAATAFAAANLGGTILCISGGLGALLTFIWRADNVDISCYNQNLA